MPDPTVKIRIEVEGKSINDLKAELKKLENSFKQTTSPLERANLAPTIAAYKDAIGEMVRETYSTNAKMKESYFSVGEELRQFYREQRLQNRTFREIGGAATDAASALNGMGISTGNLSQTISAGFRVYDSAEFAIKAMSLAAQSAGGAFAKFGVAIGNNLGKITAVAAGILAIGSAMNSLTQREEKAREALIDLNHELGTLSDEDYWNKLDERASEITRKIGNTKDQVDLWSSLGFKLLPSLFGISNADIAEMEKNLGEITTKMRKFETEITKAGEVVEGSPLDLARQRYELTGRGIEQYRFELERLQALATTELERLNIAIQLKKLKDEEEEKNKKAREEEQRNLELRQRLERASPLAGVRGGGVDIPQPGRPFNVPPIDVIKVSGGGIFSAEDTLKAENQLNEFERSAITSFARVRLTIGRSVGEGFVDAFGIGHTLLGQFVQDFISQLTSLASLGIIQGLFALIGGGGFIGGFLSAFGVKMASGGWINEPIAGVGRSGRRYLLGEEGPEYVSPVSKMNQLGVASRGQQAQNVVVRVVGEFRNRGTEMIATINRSQRIVDGLVY